MPLATLPVNLDTTTTVTVPRGAGSTPLNSDNCTTAWELWPWRKPSPRMRSSTWHTRRTKRPEGSGHTTTMRRGKKGAVQVHPLTFGRSMRVAEASGVLARARAPPSMVVSLLGLAERAAERAAERVGDRCADKAVEKVMAKILVRKTRTPIIKDLSDSWGTWWAGAQVGPVPMPRSPTRTRPLSSQ